MKQTLEQKYLSMAYEFKNLAKSGYEEAFYNITKGVVSKKQFKGYQWRLNLTEIPNICLENDYDIDSDQLIDRIVYVLKEIDKVTNSLNGVE